MESVIMKRNAIVKPVCFNHNEVGIGMDVIATKQTNKIVCNMVIGKIEVQADAEDDNKCKQWVNDPSFLSNTRERNSETLRECVERDGPDSSPESITSIPISSKMTSPFAEVATECRDKVFTSSWSKHKRDTSPLSKDAECKYCKREVFTQCYPSDVRLCTTHQFLTKLESVKKKRRSNTKGTKCGYCGEHIIDLVDCDGLRYCSIFCSLGTEENYECGCLVRYNVKTNEDEVYMTRKECECEVCLEKKEGAKRTKCDYCDEIILELVELDDLKCCSVYCALEMWNMCEYCEAKSKFSINTSGFKLSPTRIECDKSM